MEAGTQNYLTGYMPGSTTKANRLGGFVRLSLTPKAEGNIPNCKPGKGKQDKRWKKLLVQLNSKEGPKCGYSMLLIWGHTHSLCQHRRKRPVLFLMESIAPVCNPKECTRGHVITDMHMCTCTYMPHENENKPRNLFKWLWQCSMEQH